MTAAPASPADRWLEIDVAVCAELGIPLATFLAWPSSDRDRVICQYLRRKRACPETGATPTEWEPDDWQQL